MKLPSFRRLFTSDYDSQYKQLVETLSVSLNQGIQVVYEALNRQLSLRDNIKCTVKDVSFQVNALGNPVVTTSFITDVPGRIDGLTVVNAINQTNSSAYPTGGVFVSFTQADRVVTITNVTGLQPNNTYLLRLIAWNQ